MKLHFLHRSLKTRITLFTLTIFLLSLWAMAYFATRVVQEDMVELLNEQQASTAHLVADKISEELQNRLDALESLSTRLDERVMAQPNALQAVLEDHVAMNQLFNGGFFVIDREGTAIASLPVAANRIGINYMDQESIATTLTEGKPTISKVVIGRALHVPVFGMIVPKRDAQGQVIGGIVGIINLTGENFLDRIMHPYAKTGGFVVVSRQQRMMVAATDKRRVMESAPAPGVNPAIDRFLDGHEGTVAFVNPRGHEVFQSVKGIPLANWYVGVQLPVAEALAPIRDMQEKMLLAAILLTLLAGGLTWWMLRRQLKPMQIAAAALRDGSATGQTTGVLPYPVQDEIGQLVGGFNGLLETLKQREQLFQLERDSTRDILATVEAMIVALDVEGRITLVNRKACEILGYREDELLGQDWFATCLPGSIDVDQVRNVFNRPWQASSAFWNTTRTRFASAVVMSA